MRFALLGAEPDVMPLLEAIRASSQHALVATYETSDALELPLTEMFGVFASHDGWESLLLGTVADAVIVCRCQDEDRRADQLRKLTQAAIPLIIVHPVGAAILAFELQMIQQDSGGVIVPYQPDLDHPAFHTLLGTNTPVKQVSVERRMADTGAVATGQQFARDALIIRQLVGRIEQLSALGTSLDRSDDANLSVQMSAENGDIARWVVLPASEDTATQWTVHTEKGATTAIISDSGDWTVTGQDAVDDQDTATVQHADHVTLDRLAGRQAGRTMPGPDWDDACRAVELLETVDISRRRGKTIQLHYEDISEENTFKSLMTAGGCLILLFLVLLLPMLATVETLLRPTAERTSAADVDDRSDAESRSSSSSPFLQTEPKNTQERSWFGIWPLLLFCFLAFFICLQFLRLVTKSAKSQVKQSAPPAPPE
jgi:myo-inositol 2-dehydrogenase/D-chiro-inositol 1-dehydrogenase